MEPQCALHRTETGCSSFLSPQFLGTWKDGGKHLLNYLPLSKQTETSPPTFPHQPTRYLRTISFLIHLFFPFIGSLSSEAIFLSLPTLQLSLRKHLLYHVLPHTRPSFRTLPLEWAGPGVQWAIDSVGDDNRPQP